MCPLEQRTIIFAMTRPAASSRVMLLEDRRGGTATAGAVSVRRYRLARLRFQAHHPESQKRFEYLKRSYD